MARRWRLLLPLAALWAFLPSLAGAQALSEATVKAALVYKFAAYVEWPAEAFASPEAPVVLAVHGADDVGAELEQLVRGRSINKRPIVLRRLKEGDGIAGVHVLFVGRGGSARLAAIARSARGHPMLLVSDSDRGLENGSVINFVPVEDRIGFEVSIEAAERSGLRISSRMLAVARRVLQKPS